MSANFRIRYACSLCGSLEVARALDLGETPLANAFAKDPNVPDELYPLSVALCEECGHVFLRQVVPPKVLFGEYVYVSGTSPSFVKHFEDYAHQVIDALSLSKSASIVEIGSNDGTLLKAFQARGFENVLGIEPAQKIAESCAEAKIPVLCGYFNRYTSLLARQTLTAQGCNEGADVILANNVFAHIEDLEHTIEAILDLLSPEGYFIFEVSYLLDVVEKFLIDTIYHEHLSYYAVRPLQKFFDEKGLVLARVDRIATHGGSIRCWVTRLPALADTSVAQAIDQEEDAGIFRLERYEKLSEQIDEQKIFMSDVLGSIEGKIVGYGAAAKMTTLMYGLDLPPERFAYIVDDSSWKQGLYSPGHHIPIVSGAQFRIDPDVKTCVVFAWNFFDDITRREDWFSQRGGVFINPLANAFQGDR